MADPEEIYQEVLSEEQAKGSAPPVAEGRAKAARQRAVEGSPHPKEAKWWPGSQPQFEGGEAAAEAPAEEEPAEAEAPAEEPAEAPAAEVETEAAPPPAEPVAEPAELTQDQPAAPAEPAQPAAATAPQPAAPAAQPATAAQPAPAAATATLPTGVSHGTAAGNRLRPEDAVSTDVQFDAQKALLQRRKMIDELVASGVPSVSVAPAERRGSGAGMLLLYLLIPLLAIGFLVSNQDDLAGAGGGEGEHAAEGGGEGGAAGGLSISAANVAFNKDELVIPADGAPLAFVNEDTVQHNVAIYETEDAQADIFVGDVIPGGQEITYEIPAHEPGEFYFQCDVHPSMNGTAIFE